MGPFADYILTALLCTCFAPAQQNYRCFCQGTAAAQWHWRKQSLPAAKPIALGNCFDPSSSTPSPLSPAMGSNARPGQGSKALGGGGGVSVLAHAWPQRTPGSRCVAATWMPQGLKQPVPLLITASPGPGASLCFLSCM